MKVTKYVLNVNFFSKVFQILCFSYNSNNNNNNDDDDDDDNNNNNNKNNNNNNNNNNNTGEPPLSSNLLNGHPLLRGRFPKSGNNFGLPNESFPTLVASLKGPSSALYT